MVKLKISTRPYNHHDPKSPIVIEAVLKSQQGIFYHLVGNKYIYDNPSNRQWLAQMAGIHNVVIEDT